MLYESGNSNRGSVTGCDVKGGMRREIGGRFTREGTWVYLWLIPVDVCKKTTTFYKATILQF